MKRATKRTSIIQAVALVIVLLLVVASVMITTSLFKQEKYKASAEDEIYYNYTLTINSFYAPGEGYGSAYNFKIWFIDYIFKPYTFTIYSENLDKILYTENVRLDYDIDGGRYHYSPFVGTEPVYFFEDWSFKTYTENGITKKAVYLGQVDNDPDHWYEQKYVFNFSSTEDLTGVKVKVTDTLTFKETITSTNTPTSYSLTDITSAEPLYYVNNQETSYNQGYSAGYNSAELDVYERAYDEGYDNGITDSNGDYQDGYTAGQTSANSIVTVGNASYRAGQNNASLELSSVTGNALGAIGDFFMKLLSIEVAGISLWVVFAALGAIIIIGVIIKLAT